MKSFVIIAFNVPLGGCAWTSRHLEAHHEYINRAIEAEPSSFHLRNVGCHISATCLAYSVAVGVISVISIRPKYERCGSSHAVIQSFGISVSLDDFCESSVSCFGLGLACLRFFLPFLLVAHPLPDTLSIIVNQMPNTY